MNSVTKIITILGPTAVGKTKFASQLALKFNGEIISADSRQVYIGMDIGTGKDLEDYIIDGKNIPYHLINIIKPQYEFSLFQFQDSFKAALKKIIQNKHMPFLVGGTALYLNSILQNYNLVKVNFEDKDFKFLKNKRIEELKEILFNQNPKLHNKTDLLDKERLIKAIIINKNQNKENTFVKENIISLNIGIFEDREKLKQRIKDRLIKRLKEGMIDETQKLLDSGLSHEKLRYFGLEYKFLSLYLSGELNYNDMSQKLASAIIQFSKRQMTWFRKMEREGVLINWLRNTELEKAEKLINNFILP